MIRASGFRYFRHSGSRRANTFARKFILPKGKEIHEQSICIGFSNSILCAGSKGPRPVAKSKLGGFAYFGNHRLQCVPRVLHGHHHSGRLQLGGNVCESEQSSRYRHQLCGHHRHRGPVLRLLRDRCMSVSVFSDRIGALKPLRDTDSETSFTTTATAHGFDDYKRNLNGGNK
jgi:hypothetical protein